MIEYRIYSDGVICVSLFAEGEGNAERNLLHLAMRWLSPEPYRDRTGDLASTTNIMGGETDWFTLPHSFGTAIARRLIEQKVSGLEGFDETGFAKMVSWLVDVDQLHDAMCY